MKTKTNQSTIRILDKELMNYYRTKKNKSQYIRELIIDDYAKAVREGRIDPLF